MDHGGAKSLEPLTKVEIPFLDVILKRKKTQTKQIKKIFKRFLTVVYICCGIVN